MSGRPRRSITARSHLVEQGRLIRWALRRHLVAFIGAGGVLLGTPVLLVVTAGDGPGVAGRAAVEAIADAMRIDFPEGVEQLDDSFIRRFAGADDDGMVGTVARLDSDGTCWGFTVAIPAAWLREGSGSVEVGEVEALDAAVCR